MRRLFIVLMVGGSAACASIAGIDGYEEAPAERPSSADAGRDSAVIDRPDASSKEASPCVDGKAQLTVTVAASKDHADARIREDRLDLDVSPGESSSVCATIGDNVSLYSAKDDTEEHENGEDVRWTGPCESRDGKCSFKMPSEPVTVTATFD